MWSFRPGRSLRIIPATCPEDRGGAPPDGVLAPPGRQGARAAASGRPSARAASLDLARRFLFRGSAEGRAGPGCRRERGYIRARQAACVPLGGRRGRCFCGASGFPLSLLTHRCSLSRRNKSVRKPHRSHGKSGAFRSGLGGGGGEGWARGVPGWREETGLACPGKGAGERARPREVIGCLRGAFFSPVGQQAFKDTGKTPVEPEVAIHRIRITLTSRNVKSLEKGQCGGSGPGDGLGAGAAASWACEARGGEARRPRWSAPRRGPRPAPAVGDEETLTGLRSGDSRVRYSEPAALRAGEAAPVVSEGPDAFPRLQCVPT